MPGCVSISCKTNVDQELARSNRVPHCSLIHTGVRMCRTPCEQRYENCQTDVRSILPLPKYDHSLPLVCVWVPYRPTLNY